MIKHTPLLLISLAAPAHADVLPPLLCQGQAPQWELSLSKDTANFVFQRESEMTIPQRSVAEGQEWPKAMTLISRGDTAIVIIDRRQCGNADYVAHVLTQRGETPVLLTGCCAATS